MRPHLHSQAHSRPRPWLLRLHTIPRGAALSRVRNSVRRQRSRRPGDRRHRELAARVPNLPISITRVSTTAPNAKAGVLAELARQARHEVLLVNDGDIFVPPLSRRRGGAACRCRNRTGDVPLSRARRLRGNPHGGPRHRYRFRSQRPGGAAFGCGRIRSRFHDGLPRRDVARYRRL